MCDEMELTQGIHYNADKHRRLIRDGNTKAADQLTQDALKVWSFREWQRLINGLVPPPPWR